MDISVVVPAFNEARRIGSSLLRIVDHLDRRGVSHEVLVVDDGSTDGTVEVVDGLGLQAVRLIRLPVNRGKGAALRCGVATSRGRMVLLTDADLSTPIEELDRLIPHLAPDVLVFGSRACKGARVERPQAFHRRSMGKCFNLIVRCLGIQGLSDTQCGFKLLDGETARRLFRELITDGFAFDVELLWLARRRGCRAVEVGVRWSDAPGSRVHVVLDSMRMLRDVTTFRLRHASDRASEPRRESESATYAGRDR